MLRRKKSFEALEPWLELEALADALDLPRDWIVCPMCAEFFWRLPPHGFNPCPLVAGMAEATGLKLDAERMTAVKAGVHLESMGAAMRAFIEEHGLEEEDEENE